MRATQKVIVNERTSINMKSKKEILSKITKSIDKTLKYNSKTKRTIKNVLVRRKPASAGFKDV